MSAKAKPKHALRGVGPISVDYDDDRGIVLSVWSGVVAEDDAGCWVKLTVGQAQRLASDLSRALIGSGVMRGRGHRHVPCDGSKRRYDTPEAARAAHASAGWRVRVYHCVPCDGYHTSNGDKQGTAS